MKHALNRNKIIEKLREILDRERFDHSLRVEKSAVTLAKKHGVSTEKARLAALLHDYARQYSRKGLLRLAKRFGLKIDPIRKSEPKLFHAELSALLAKRDFRVASAEILNAIRKHTIGGLRMNKLEKIIYLADHIEEGRGYKGIKKIRSLATKNLDQAIVQSATLMLKYLLDQGLPIYPGTNQTRNYYLLKS